MPKGKTFEIVKSIDYTGEEDLELRKHGNFMMYLTKQELDDLQYVIYRTKIEFYSEG